MPDIPPGTPVVIAGRTVANYLQCGEAPPAGHTIGPCYRCREPVCISAEAAKMMEEPGRQAFIVCTACMIRFAARSKELAGVASSAQGEAALAENPLARAFVAALQSKVRKP